MSTRNGIFLRSFVFDTAAAITHFPRPLADQLGIVYPEEYADEDECPRTLAGKLTGHLGELCLTLLDKDLNIPCFFYVPNDDPMSGMEAGGPPGKKTVNRKIRNVDEWEAAVSGEESATSKRFPCILGRLGFLNRFNVLIQGNHTIISTDPFPDPLPPPAPRRRR